MILAAGRGTRLAPITDVLPKALVPVGSAPLLLHVIRRLEAQGFDRAIVNVHHHAEQVACYLRYVAHHHFRHFDISDESRELLDTGGAIRYARPLFAPDEPVLVHNVDILSNADLAALYHGVGHTADAALLVSERTTKRYLLFDDDMCLRGWINTATGETKGDANPQYRRLAFSGIHVLAPRLLQAMDSEPERFSIIDFYLSHCRDYNIKGVVQPYIRLLDVGKLDTLATAEQFLTQLQQ